MSGQAPRQSGRPHTSLISEHRSKLSATPKEFWPRIVGRISLLTCSPWLFRAGGLRVLSVEDWADFRRLHRAEGLPIKVIARTLVVARNTVRVAIA